MHLFLKLKVPSDLLGDLLGALLFGLRYWSPIKA